MKKTIIPFLAFIFLFAGIPVVKSQWSRDSLNSGRIWAQAALVGDKAIFVNNNAEIYDIVTGVKTTKTFAVARTRIAGAGTPARAWFAGGYSGPYTDPVYRKTVDIYTAATNAWTTTNLSQARVVSAVGRLGNKVFFAGGRTALAYAKRVDIFNDADNTHIAANLSQPRDNIAVAAAGSKIIFAGGETGQVGFAKESNRADIYDDATQTWSTGFLSQKRLGIAGAGVGNKIIFAGGFNSLIGASDKIDIYDVATNTWTTATLSAPRYNITVAVADNKAYFVGGWDLSGYFTPHVDIYDAVTNTWSSMTLPVARGSMTVAVTNSRIMFAGGGITAYAYAATDRIEVIDRTTGIWSVEYLSSPRLGSAAVTTGNKAFFAGGAPSGSVNAPISKIIDIWTDPMQLTAALPENSISVIYDAAAPSADIKTADFTIYPNPAFDDYVQLRLDHFPKGEVRVAIMDLSGKPFGSFRIDHTGDSTETLDISGLPNGTYLIAVQSDGRSWISKKWVVQK